MPRNAAGQFVSKKEDVVPKARTREEILAELAALDATEEDRPIDPMAEDPPAEEELESLVLQSKFTNHTISLIPTRRVFHPEAGMIEPVPGLFAQFTGPQRIFDSLVEQAKWGWTDEQRELVEKKLVSNEGYMKDFFPAPLKQIPDRLKSDVRVKEAVKQKFCMAFGYQDGNLIQCHNPATAGRDFCVEHDPNVSKIITGGGTTVG